MKTIKMNIKILKYLPIIMMALFFSFSMMTDANAGMSGSDKKFAIGFQTGFSAWGISGKMDLSEKVTAQAIIGSFGSVSNYAARGLYRFRMERNWNAYGFGTVGIWMWDGGGGFRDETAIGFGGGAGIEVGLEALLTDIAPPITWNIELGAGFVNFDHYNGFSTISFGTGLHYHF